MQSAPYSRKKFALGNAAGKYREYRSQTAGDGLSPDVPALFALTPHDLLQPAARR
jgi:hypothetical protein